jgi:hypothetical protein
MRWAERVERARKKKVLVGKPEQNRPLRRFGLECMDKTEMDVTKTGPV